MKQTMIMPTVFGVLFILLIIGYSMIFLLFPIPLVIKIAVGAVVAALAAAMVYVIIQRKRELEKEDHDDLSNY